MILMLCIAGFVAGAPVFADGIYRWEDESGQLHYSDVPRKGAEEIDLEPAQTFSAPAIVSSAPSGGQSDTANTDYQVFAVGSPKSEETFWNTGGKLNVSVNLQPDLRPGHQIHLYLDGQPQGILRGGKTNMTLQEVYRGEHRVYAQVRDVNNRVLMETPAVKFFMQQTVSDDNQATKPAPGLPAVDPGEPVPRSQVPVSRRKSVR
jgi:hypothetical protein